MYENNKPTISNGNEMLIKCPNENFILTIEGTAGTITVYRADDKKRAWVQFEDTYDMEGTSDNISMIGFPFGCYVKLVTTGTFTDAHVTCGRA